MARTIFTSQGVGQPILVRSEGTRWSRVSTETLEEFCLNPLPWYTPHQVAAARRELRKREREEAQAGMAAYTRWWIAHPWHVRGTPESGNVPPDCDCGCQDEIVTKGTCAGCGQLTKYGEHYRLEEGGYVHQEQGGKAMRGQYTSVCTLCGKPATDGLCYRESGYVYHADCWIKYQQELRKTRTGS